MRLLPLLRMLLPWMPPLLLLLLLLQPLSPPSSPASAGGGSGASSGLVGAAGTVLSSSLRATRLLLRLLYWFFKLCAFKPDALVPRLAHDRCVWTGPPPHWRAMFIGTHIHG